MREANFKAATAGLQALKTLLPGLRYDVGDMPEEWQAWTWSNLAREVPPLEILTKLFQKGFRPGRNATFMQRFQLKVSSGLLRQV